MSTIEKLQISEIDWGSCSDETKVLLSREHGNSTSIYERYFEVEENDYVLDIGAHIGTFCTAIVHRNPRLIVCVEPMEYTLEPLRNNLKTAYSKLGLDYKSSTRIFEYAISDSDGTIELQFDYHSQVVQKIAFSNLINEVDKLGSVDFMKIDCEGGEYHIFTDKHLDFINNVPKIACEFHLRNTHIGSCKERFRYVRDHIFPNITGKINVSSVDGVDILWNLHSDDFINYYSEINVYIDNRLGNTE